jgi:hypothetical protein
MTDLSPLDREVGKVRRKRRRKEALKQLGKIIKVRDGMRKRGEKL